MSVSFRASSVWALSAVIGVRIWWAASATKLCIVRTRRSSRLMKRLIAATSASTSRGVAIANGVRSSGSRLTIARSMRCRGFSA